MQVSAGYGDSRRRILVANSDGLLADDDRVRTRLFVTCVASGDGGMQTGFREHRLHARVRACSTTIPSRRRPERRPAGPSPSSRRVRLRRACSRSCSKRQRRYPLPRGVRSRPRGGPHLEGQLGVHAVASARRSPAPGVTLVDDGTLGPNWGSAAIDDEGRPTQRNVLIRDGVLTDYMWDYLRGARKEGRTSSGNGRRQSYEDLPMVRMTNTYLLAGEEDPDEIVAQTPNGVYVAQLGGGQVNTATGDFVFGMTEAYLIENGRITEPLRNANLIGNGPDVLSKIDAIGNDFEMSPGNVRQGRPERRRSAADSRRLRVTGVTIGGTASA